MPALLLAIAGLFGVGYAFEKADQLAKDTGLFSTGSQTNVPEAKGTIGQNIDKAGTSVAVGLLIISASYAYSLVKR